jgi:hypothetical protein
MDFPAPVGKINSPGPPLLLSRLVALLAKKMAAIRAEGGTASLRRFC